MIEVSNEVIVERLHGLTKLIEEKFEAVNIKLDQNAVDHKTLAGKQDHTNGGLAEAKVEITKLQLWKAYLVGAWAVVSIVLVGILVPLVNFYLTNKK